MSFFVILRSLLTTMSRRGVSEIGDEELAMVVAEERQQMSTILRDLPKLQAPDEHTKPLGLGEISAVDLDFDPLVKMRRTHQTRQAAFGVRTRSHNTWDAASGNGSETSIKMRIVRQMHDVLKEQDEHAVGTGYERAARWGNSGKIETAGNAANAAAAAATVARRVSGTHCTSFINGPLIISHRLLHDVVLSFRRQAFLDSPMSKTLASPFYALYESVIMVLSSQITA